jgi:hypothetical protein
VSLNDLDRQACEDICGQIIRCRGALLPLGCLPPIGRVGMTTVCSGLRSPLARRGLDLDLAGLVLCFVPDVARSSSPD